MSKIHYTLKVLLLLCRLSCNLKLVLKGNQIILGKAVKAKLKDEQTKDLKFLESDGNTKDQNICGVVDFHEQSNPNSLLDKIPVPAATLQQCLQSINREDQR